METQKNFNVTKSLKDELAILELSGYLDAHTAPVLEQTIENCLNEKRFYILVDFENLEYISSAGLGVFMAYIEEIRNNNGDLKMTNMKDKVFNIFDLLGFPMLFDIDKSAESSMEKFKHGIIKNNE